MTVRELRQLLFQVQDQELTVKELRAILFQVLQQDEEITELQLRRLTGERNELK